MPACRNPFVNRKCELPMMVGVLRSAYGRHVGEPEWERFIRELSAAGPEFAELWGRYDVADPAKQIKVFRHYSVGEVRMSSTSLTVAGAPEDRLLVYTPMDRESAERIGWLLEHPDAPVADHSH